jgi:hypothetical protein
MSTIPLPPVYHAAMLVLSPIGPLLWQIRMCMCVTDPDCFLVAAKPQVDKVLRLGNCSQQKPMALAVLHTLLLRATIRHGPTIHRPGSLRKTRHAYLFRSGLYHRVRSQNTSCHPSPYIRVSHRMDCRRVDRPKTVRVIAIARSYVKLNIGMVIAVKILWSR